MLNPQHREIAPPATLAHAVACLWHEPRGGGTFDVLPDGYVELIVRLGGPCALLRDGGWHDLPPQFVVGLLDGPLTLRSGGPLHVLGVRCWPWAAFDLLGMPADGGAVRPLAAPLAHRLMGLAPALADLVAAGDIDAALGLLAAQLAQAVPQPTLDTVAKAGAALRDAYGTLPVSAVAAAAHATVRTLERKFKRASGHTVKDVAGVMRFEQARNRLVREPGARLALLAQELGFTDQAHLSREFKRYSGVAPATFARRVRSR